MLKLSFTDGQGSNIIKWNVLTAPRIKVAKLSDGFTEKLANKVGFKHFDFTNKFVAIVLTFLVVYDTYVQVIWHFRENTDFVPKIVRFGLKKLKEM